MWVIFENKLKFKKHITTICQKANRKLNALTRVTSYVDLQKRRILMNSFFNSQFNYYPVIWAFHSGALNNKINRLLDRCVCISYKDQTSTFNDLLEKDSSVSIHYRDIQALAIEMFKVTNGMSPVIMKKYFNLEKNLIITNVVHLTLPSHRFVLFTMVVSLRHIWDLKFGDWFHQWFDK